MCVSTITAQNWEDVYMHVTMMKLAKINAWTSSKLDNSTALARYMFCLIIISHQLFRRIALAAVLVMITLVLRQQQLQT